jgi:hypothetical protein
MHNVCLNKIFKKYEGKEGVDYAGADWMFRLGFVSNSSSCSFVCPVCDNSQFGWDWDEDPVCDKCGVHISVEFISTMLRHLQNSSSRNMVWMKWRRENCTYYHKVEELMTEFIGFYHVSEKGYCTKCKKVFNRIRRLFDETDD